MGEASQTAETHRGHALDSRTGGYTLVEMLVAIGIFAIVMTIATGALFSLVDANRKARSLNTTMTNFNFALDAMSRDIRTGYDYRCENWPVSGTSPRDCAGGGNTLILEGESGDPSNPNDQIIYVYDASNNVVRRSRDGGSTYEDITSRNLDLTDFQFYVTGAGRTTGPSSDTQQPHVTITAAGAVGENEARSTFEVQTTVTQRVLDF